MYELFILKHKTKQIIFILVKVYIIVFGRKFGAQLPFFNYVVTNTRFHKK